MMPKIVLEFTDEERQFAEDAFYGSNYKSALIQTRELLRGTIKYKQLSEESEDVLLNLQREFFEIISDLPLD